MRPFFISIPQYSVHNQAFFSHVPHCFANTVRVHWLTWKPYIFILVLAFRLLSLHAETSVIYKCSEKPGNLQFVLSYFSPRVTLQMSMSKIIPFAKSYATSYELSLLLRSLLKVQKAMASKLSPACSACYFQVLLRCCCVIGLWLQSTCSNRHYTDFQGLAAAVISCCLTVRL